MFVRYAWNDTLVIIENAQSQDRIDVIARNEDIFVILFCAHNVTIQVLIWSYQHFIEKGISIKFLLLLTMSFISVTAFPFYFKSLRGRGSKIKNYITAFNNNGSKTRTAIIFLKDCASYKNQRRTVKSYCKTLIHASIFAGKAPGFVFSAFFSVRPAI